MGWDDADLITLAMLAGLAMPPKPYDHVPKRMPQIIEFRPGMINAACGAHNEIASCFIRGKVFIRTDLTKAARAKVLWHEYGHANGWEHD